jgi:hypothetical protein
MIDMGNDRHVPKGHYLGIRMGQFALRRNIGSGGRIAMKIAP